MPNVHKIPVSSVFRANSLQLIEDFDYSDFCALLEAGTADSVFELRGMIILQFPHASIICNGDHCTLISTKGSSVDLYVREAHVKICQYSEEAAA